MDQATDASIQCTRDYLYKATESQILSLAPCAFGSAAGKQCVSHMLLLPWYSVSWLANHELKPSNPRTAVKLSSSQVVILGWPLCVSLLRSFWKYSLSFLGRNTAEMYISWTLTVWQVLTSRYVKIGVSWFLVSIINILPKTISWYRDVLVFSVPCQLALSPSGLW